MSNAQKSPRPKTLTIALPEPLQGATFSGDSSMIQEITLREPTAGEWEKAMNKSGFETTIELVSLITGQMSNIVRRMPVSVVVEAGDFILGFLGQKTGGDT